MPPRLIRGGYLKPNTTDVREINSIFYIGISIVNVILFDDFSSVKRPERWETFFILNFFVYR